MSTIHKPYKFPHEVFEELSKIESFHDRVEFLKQWGSFAVRSILQANFTPGIQFDLPVGPPPFQADSLPPENSSSRIEKSIKILGRLVKGQTPSSLIHRGQCERKFIQFLESIAAKDAEIIVAMKDKELTKLYPAMDQTLAKAAFPEIIP